MESYIDRTFREYGAQTFGTEAMNSITSEQIEEARCAAFRAASALTEKYGRLPNGSTKTIFCYYVQMRFLNK